MDLEDGGYWKALINMSLTKFLILQTLHQEPCHGYAILAAAGTLHGRLLYAELRGHLPGAEGARGRRLR